MKTFLEPSRQKAWQEYRTAPPGLKLKRRLAFQRATEEALRQQVKGAKNGQH